MYKLNKKKGQKYDFALRTQGDSLGAVKSYLWINCNRVNDLQTFTHYCDAELSFTHCTLKKKDKLCFIEK